MKARLISAGVGLSLAAVIIWLIETPILTVLLGILGAIAVMEAMRAFGFIKHYVLLIVNAVLFLASLFMELNVANTVAGFILIFFAALIFNSDIRAKLPVFAAQTLTVISTYIGFASINSIRRFSVVTWDKRGLFLLCLGTALFCDTYAFTFGKLFGKHKLCPEISPNKTIEGAMGGLLLTPPTVCLMVSLFAKADGSVFSSGDGTAKYIFFAVVGLIGAAFGMLGDLSFSCIKRYCGIKDYGKIMPGHGGVLDRFDSVIFTSVFITISFKMFMELFVK